MMDEVCIGSTGTGVLDTISDREDRSSDGCFVGDTR